MAFQENGDLLVASSLGGRKGIVRVTRDGNAELAVSGSGLVGLAFYGNALVLASSNSLYYLNWGSRGWPLLR